MFSRDDFKKAIVEGHLKIIPYEEKNLTGIGYNLSTTNFAFSINQGLLLKIYTDTTNEGYIHYVKVPENDTVLFFSKEFLETDNTIAGTFHSKVSRVCQGFGHVSTTLDPMWKGQLIIAVNNPTNKSIRFDLDKNNGNIFTLLIDKLDSNVTGKNVHDNNRGRCDLLLSHFAGEEPSWFHKEKHLELKTFIVGEFANSLNGYDDFMNTDRVDKYKKSIENLKDLKEQLKTDRLLISEGRYVLGVDGMYQILRDDMQKKIIRECSIFGLKEARNNMSCQYSADELLQKKQTIIKEIDDYLAVIDYELETINHNRRISWQNDKISQYAMENSKIFKYRRRKYILTRLVIVITFAIAILAIYNFEYSRMIRNGVDDLDVMKQSMQIIFTGIMTTISAVVAHAISKWNERGK